MFTGQAFDIGMIFQLYSLVISEEDKRKWNIEESSRDDHILSYIYNMHILNSNIQIRTQSNSHLVF